ncbi:MAG: GNAT family N-acetyltransferase [Labilithrix sp.]|nr:GNAT family N-acetyltransferase [Labilithrix sp.]MCW5810436.1 GNAT family N-acetyltransferase [Labilithrix sp.]
MSGADLSTWTPRPRPDGSTLEGRYARLERLAAKHAETLDEASRAEPERYRWLFDSPPPDRAATDAWIEAASRGADPLFYAVIDRATGRAEGRQAYLRITPEHGVIEIGSILWGPRIARTRVATEALWLFAQHAFVDLGYRRFEWKCDAENEPSRRAALRFGFTFEGTFAQHMIVKGRNRDTAWFAILDRDWPRISAAIQRWLAPTNFTPTGHQHTPLSTSR